jgi:hypothetical protein
MLKILQLKQLQAELAATHELLENSRTEGDFVGEIQYEERAKNLENKIKQVEEYSDKKARVALFFGGNPVIGSRAISAEFSGKMLKYFQDLVSKDFAISEFGDLGERGIVPTSASNQLMVTGVALGSFGFTLEEVSDQEEMFTTSLRNSVDNVVSRLNDITSENESKFLETLEGINSRELITLKKFFSTLNNSSATMRIAEDEAEFVYDEIAIQRGKDRVDRSTIKEEPEIITCQLTGILPEKLHRFEARLDDGEIITGLISKEGMEDYERQKSHSALEFPMRWTLKFDVRKITTVNKVEKTVYILVGFVQENPETQD